jgi:hypothetical protein
MNTENLQPILRELEDVFGPPSQAGFGSAVFFFPEGPAQPSSLEQHAQQMYQHFCGEIWERFGVDNWLKTWKQLLQRTADSRGHIVKEIEALKDPEAGSAAGLLLDAGGDPSRAQAALAAAFDSPAITGLQIFKIGDGGAMSGALIAAEMATGARLFLIILLD